MTAKPSICFVAPNAFPVLSGDLETPVIGGAEVQQVTVARGLAERGYPVSMVCRDFGQDDKVEIDGVTVFRAFRLDRGLPFLKFFWPRLTSIWRCMKSADADIYYQRSAGMLTGIVAGYCQWAGKKSIFASAGNPDLERPTTRVKYTRDRWLYEYGLRHMDQIVVQNDEQARLSRLHYGRDVTQIPNCYHPAGRPKTVPRRDVLWVSTIREIKRPEIFLSIAERLPGYSFRMIGGLGRDEEGLFEKVRSRAATLRNMEFLGFVPYAEVDAYFAQASVFVNTSESEGFPNTFLQSWARSVPTVSFVDSGARLDGRAVGCQVADVDEMIDCVEKWLVDEQERLEVGTRCHEYFESNHSPKHALDLYEQVFAKLMTGTGR